ncbi:MAG: hypothetical protein GVY24_01270 [Planctomycetes bacterium]|jgi:hypothetical protein|nr:hypothetical protein [Planctomycetota bacterium]
MAHDAEVHQGTPNFDTRLVFVIGLVAAVLFFTVIVAIWAGFEFVWNQEVYEKQYRRPYPQLVEITQQQRALIDGSQGGMSIEEAMEKIAERQPSR